jgi:hypothetical protein
MIDAVSLLDWRRTVAANWIGFGWIGFKRPVDLGWTGSTVWMLLELQLAIPSPAMVGVVANATIGYPNAWPPTRPQQCPDTPTTVPRHTHNSAQTRPQQCPDTPATVPADACNNAGNNNARTRPQQRPGSAKRLATTDRRGWKRN